MTTGVFLDSGIFIAFLVRADALHRQAVSLFSRPPAAWLTSVLVLAETYGWFLHRAGEEAARQFRALVGELPGLELVGTDERHHAAVGRKLDAFRGARLTYVDASSLVWLAERKVDTVWGTDHHLALEGARVIPGPPAPRGGRRAGAR
ncbi:MAG TPA: PIN domain-containing protein [Thermoanaerobaculia bacterium]|nr:PIN domain-containing protein [Thermoanaerobaculia bacterium]